MSHKHPSSNHVFSKWLRRVFIAVTFLGLGVLIGSRADAYEGFFDGDTLYKWTGIFDGAGLMYPIVSTGGMDIIDMHGTEVKLILSDECATLIIDVPSIGPSILECVKGEIIGQTEEE